MAENRVGTSSASGHLVEFRPGNEAAVWSQVLLKISDVLRDHVRVVTSSAISGPNQLDLFFPRNYHFSKQYCERNDVRVRLEKLVSDVAARPVTITCRLAKDDLEMQGESRPRPARTTPGDGSSRTAAEPTGDPYVEQAKSIFGATVVKRDTMQPASPEES